MALEKINFTFKNKGEEGYEETPLTKEKTNDAYKKIDAAIEFLNKSVSVFLGIEEDTYSNTATYDLDDVVVYENVPYYCIAAITNPEEFNPEHWEVFSILKRKELEDKIKLNSVIEKMIEQICINKNVYSEDEIIIGYILKNTKKIPIYRKYVSGTFVSSNTKVDVNLFENVDEIINVYGTWSPDGVGIIAYGSNDLLANGTINSSLSVRKTSMNIALLREFSTAFNGYTGNYKLYIEYTKITDLQKEDEE